MIVMQDVSLPKCRVYRPQEVNFLKGVVREALRARKTDAVRSDAQSIARDVLNAYSGSVVDRDGLLTIARASTPDGTG